MRLRPGNKLGGKIVATGLNGTQVDVGVSLKNFFFCFLGVGGGETHYFHLVTTGDNPFSLHHTSPSI